MNIELTSEANGLKSYTLQDIGDTDLVLLIAGSMAARQFLLSKINIVLNTDADKEITAKNFTYLQKRAMAFDYFIAQVTQVCNEGHRLEARDLINLPK